MEDLSYAGLYRPAAKRQAIVYDLLLVFGASIIIALSAQFAFSVPFSPVPITLQTFAVLLVGAFLGPRLGTLSAVAYLLEGAAGLPVFAHAHGGFVHLFGSTGGYLIGFIPAAFVTGTLVEYFKTRSAVWVFLVMLTGTLIIFVFGLTWLSLVFETSNVLLIGFYPFLPGAVLKIIAATLVFVAGGKIINSYSK